MASTSARISGYHGRYLRIDVESGRGEFIDFEPQRLRQFLGGVGLATHLLLDHDAAMREPLAPEAPLVFSFSPLVGSPLTTSAKFAVVGKSPLTDRLNDSLCSSAFAIAGKQCGCDAMLIHGRATQPSILIIDDGRIRLEPAQELWGMTCGAAESRLADRFGRNYEFAVIGPAGENLVRYATISHDGRHAGRGGSGAVLGAKNIKAIAVRGSQHVSWSHPRQLVALSKQLSRASFGPATAKYRELGTAANLLTFNRLHALPTRNFQQGHFAAAPQLAPEALSLARQRTQKSCACCTIGCEHIYALPGGDGSAGGTRVEYENLFALGPLCDIDDPEIVLQASRRCDELGLDTISAGGTIAFAMECRQRGLLDGSWPSFGDGPGLLAALDKIARRDGIGDSLAAGSRRLAKQIGNGSIDFAPQVKGLEIPGYEPRALQTMALGFAVGARGADHNRSGAYEVDFSNRVDRRNATSEAAKLAVETEDKAALMDSLILCKFLRGVFQDFFAEAAHMLSLVTDWEFTADELRTTAQRIVTAKKLFNIQAGWQPDEDTLPARMLSEPVADDAQARLTSDKLRELVRAYNTARNWTLKGYPTTEGINRLGLPAFRSL